jgi:hypothetical protein
MHTSDLLKDTEFICLRMSNPTALVQKLWNYSNMLPPLPAGYGGQAGDYVEPLTFLLFRTSNVACGRATYFQP